MTQSHIISVFLFIILGIWHFYWSPTATPSNKSLVSGISNYQQCQEPKERREDKWQLAGERTVGARWQQRSPRPLLPDLDLQEVFHLSFRIPANLWNLGSRASDAPMGFSKLRGCRNRAPSHGDSAFRNAEESPNKDTSQAVSTM